MRGGEADLRYWVEYVTLQGERLPWSGFTSSKDDKLECIRLSRILGDRCRAGYALPRPGASTIGGIETLASVSSLLQARSLISTDCQSLLRESVVNELLGRYVRMASYQSSVS